MTGRQTANISLVCFLGAFILIAITIWLGYNYPSWATQAQLEPVGFHTDVLRGACYTLSENGQ